MVSPHCGSQLVLCALIWLFVVLHRTGPKRPVTARATPTAPEPLTPKRHRATAPKPCEGLTHQPPGALCERATSQPNVPPPLPPAPRPSTHRRPRAIATARPWCPHSHGASRGGLGLGHLRAHGHPRGGPGRQCHWTAWQGDVLETHGPICHGHHAAVDRIVRVLAWLAEGLGSRATARGFAVAPNTVLQWRGEAAEPLRAFAAYFLCALPREQRQLDEVYAVRRDRQAGAISDAAAIKRLARSPSWGWTAMAPRSKGLVVVDVGHRTLARGQRVVHQGTRVLAPGCVPLFLPDGLQAYATALLAHGGQGRPPARRQPKGPMPQPRWLPLPALLYAQVVKAYRRQRLVGGTHRVGVGTQRAIAQVLAACGGTIHTAFIERLTLDIRQRVAAVGRRVHPLCRGEEGLRAQLVVFQTSHNGVLPHASLRQPRPVAKATNGGSAKGWRPWTPAMAAGLTDHVWSRKEVLLYRVPPWPQAQTP
jgi:hypothetical protein